MENKTIKNIFEEELKEIVLTREERKDIEKKLENVVSSGKGGGTTTGCNCQL